MGEPVLAAARLLPISTTHLIAALLCGFALRLYFVTHFPFYSGDTKFYEELARNWLDHRVYGLFISGQLMPVDQRVPGYPAFLATIYALFGRTRTAVMLAEAAVDLATCVLAACITARIAPATKKSLAATVALWLAVLCPFMASYSAAILTETFAAFFTTLALLILVSILSDSSRDWQDAQRICPDRGDSDKRTLRLAGGFALAGFVAGLGTLVRPETPLLPGAAAVITAMVWRGRADWKKFALATLWMAVGLLATLVPWAARNAQTMGRVEFLAPRYAESAGDYMPRGFYAWTRTWMVHYRDAFTITWALGKKPIPLDAIPNSAFDSDVQHQEVANLLAAYNANLKMPPALDRKFEILAHERIAAHPLGTLLAVPVKRAFAIWFTPRVDVLRFSGELFPLREQWRAKPAELSVTVIFVILNFAYLALAAVGTWRYRTSLGCTIFVLYFVLRTALLTQLTTVEPRYVVVCFPAIAALGALAFVKPLPRSCAQRGFAHISDLVTNAESNLNHVPALSPTR